MDSLRGLIAYTHMGSFSIIKHYDTAQYLQTLPDILYFHYIKPFGLKYAIGMFGDRILQGITALSHADHDGAFFQCPHISGTAILTSTVRVVDEPACGFVIYGGQCHLECLQRICGLQGRSESPADYLMRISIRFSDR